MSCRLQVGHLVPLFTLVLLGSAKVLGNQGGAPNSPKGPGADNSRCYVCHVNYEDELIAQVHAAANIGCINCHGLSRDHASDEDNTTAPDTMYPREKIDSACIKCHESENFRTVHKTLATSSAAKNKVCTDCHGQHRLAFRTRHWDKSTGKLLTNDKEQRGP